MRMLSANTLRRTDGAKMVRKMAPEWIIASQFVAIMLVKLVIPIGAIARPGWGRCTIRRQRDDPPAAHLGEIVMACERKYAVVIVRTSGERFVLVPSADREFCEEVAKEFNATAERGGDEKASVAPVLVW